MKQRQRVNAFRVDTNACLSATRSTGFVRCASKPTCTLRGPGSDLVALLEQASGIAPIYHTLAAMLVKPHVTGMVENKRPADTFVAGDWYPELWKTSKS